MKYRLLTLLLCLSASLCAVAQNGSNVIDEIVWVVGDDPILLSDIEEMRIGQEESGEVVNNPYCTIPEQLAVQKLFLHQADLDSIEASEAEVNREVDYMLENAIQNFYGSRENLEAVTHKTYAQLRDMRKRMVRDQNRIEQLQRKLVENVKVTPAEVREYFKSVPTDSLPYIAKQVEVEIITREPQVPRQEVERIEAQLREWARSVNAGESAFATLARFYSEDAGSARNGGELGYKGRGELVPEFANVAFSLNDPKKVSKIVKSEYGYHIIQLIDKRGDKVNCRHILIKPQIADSVLRVQLNRLDSVASEIRSGKFTFEDAATFISDDKDTKNNHGLMNNYNERTGVSTARFEMKDLNQDIAKVVDTLEVGQISQPFVFTNRKGQQVCAIIKLKERIDGHRATTTEDFQILRQVVHQKRCQERIDQWVAKKAETTYVRISPNWRNCDFKYKWQQ
ncbi:MAG: peptidylprolyl isomerase [Alloprevotella sp.]|nr:peptidylprolyl isomerase [Alloprevotella sp.]